jgi:hypothetical protein
MRLAWTFVVATVVAAIACSSDDKSARDSSTAALPTSVNCEGAGQLRDRGPGSRLESQT